ncbi:MAG TPA: DUF4190 domain-containing protein [Miltoncostaeaceae bacterium]|nr:DUF4190 domain-containing protein [Miltoncostaeaceae bacterium]
MSTPAGWYDDPTRPGRQRYWDGSTWTEWVSENGQTVSEPLGATPAPATGTPTGAHPVPEALQREDVQPTPGIAHAPGGGWGGGPAVGTGSRGAIDYPITLLGRIGFGLLAVAGILTAIAANQDATRDASGLRGYNTDEAVIVLGVLLVAAGVAGALLKPYWVRLVSLLVAGGTIGFALLFLIGARSGDAFLSTDDVELRTGWWLVAAGAMIGVVGVVLATIFITEPQRGPAPSGGPASSPKPTLSLVLSLVGLLLAPLAPVGAGFGFLAKRDIAASGGRLGGNGMAVAGIVVGLVATALWFGGLIIGALVASP